MATAYRGACACLGARGAQAELALSLARDSNGMEVQGIGNFQRQIIRTLSQFLDRTRRTAVAERFVVTALSQVTRYVSDDLVRAWHSSACSTSLRMTRELLSATLSGLSWHMNPCTD